MLKTEDFSYLDSGYGDWRNSGEVVNMKHLDDEGKKSHVKKYGMMILKNILNGKNGASD